MLSGDEFIRRVVPSLSRLFASSDRNLRRNLLESIDTYGQHLTTVSFKCCKCTAGLTCHPCMLADIEQFALHVCICTHIGAMLRNLLESIDTYGQHLTTVSYICCHRKDVHGC
jgi:hypothetical protein